MDRAGFAVLVVLTVALLRFGDSHQDATGGRKEGTAAAGRAVRSQRQSRVRSQGHSPWRAAHGASPGPSGTDSFRTVLRVPRAAHQRHASRAGPARAADASREILVSPPRDGAPRAARHPSGQQHRARGNLRQSSKLSSGSTRRLAGPNVCGGQQCCSGWAGDDDVETVMLRRRCGDGDVETAMWRRRCGDDDVETLTFGRRVYRRLSLRPRRDEKQRSDVCFAALCS
ncbi:hypothetical protein EYF80_037467 [Liparis tanakae]|uniref:Uncharacterized protein n=1 Tax=Liparis tanakae TaxID=230148 RepID=A0A4Z2GHE2_9TELE|nr:hypothetical protein EYF80_037467 [Liparis tanakae]